MLAATHWSSAPELSRGKGQFTHARALLRHGMAVSSDETDIDMQSDVQALATAIPASGSTHGSRGQEGLGSGDGDSDDAHDADADLALDVASSSGGGAGGLSRGLTRRSLQWALGQAKRRMMLCGPSTEQGLRCWPESFCEALAKKQLLDRAVSKLNMGIVLDSDYSGSGCMEQAAAMFRDSMRSQQVLAEGSPSFMVHRVCDNDPMCRRTLHGHCPGPEHPRHIFGDLCERIDASTLFELVAIAERWSANVAELTSHCNTADVVAISKKAGQAMVREMVVVMNGATIKESGWCWKHDGLCRFFQAGRLNIWSAGNRCLSRPSYGKRESWNGKDTIPFLVWCFSVLHARPHLFMEECTPSFDLSVVHDILGHAYNLQSRILCPSQFGAGCLRRRQWCVGALKSAVKVNFPFDGKEFEDIFFREAQLGGDAYFVAAADQREAAVRELLGTRRNRRKPSSSSVHRGKLATEELPPGLACRLKGYKMLLEHRDMRTAIANLTQNPDCRPWLHRKLQTLLTKSTVVLMRSRRLGHDIEQGALLLTADEHLNAMGWPMFCDGKVNLLREVAAQLDVDFKKHLAGNGMHIMVAGAVLLYLLVATESVD